MVSLKGFNLVINSVCLMAKKSHQQCVEGELGNIFGLFLLQLPMQCILGISGNALMESIVKTCVDIEDRFRRSFGDD